MSATTAAQRVAGCFSCAALASFSRRTFSHLLLQAVFFCCVLSDVALLLRHSGRGV